MYLPRYMSVMAVESRKESMTFDFVPVEPQVTVLSSQYMTPRGAHVCVSQAVYAFAEEIAPRLFGIDVKKLREVYLGGRLRLRKILFDHKKELETDGTFPGRLDLIRFRPGRIPYIEMNYDLGDGALVGFITGVIAPQTVPQTNQDILRREI